MQEPANAALSTRQSTAPRILRDLLAWLQGAITREATKKRRQLLRVGGAQKPQDLIPCLLKRSRLRTLPDPKPSATSVAHA